MNNSRIFSITISTIFILSMVTISINITNAEMPALPNVGDTLIYEITEYNVPDIADITTMGSITSNIDLIGSELGIKILSSNSTTYQYGMYLKSDKDMSITVDINNFNNKSTKELPELLTGAGDLLIDLPAGIAFPIVENHMNYYLWNDSLPIWLKEVDWNSARTEVENYGGSVTDNGNSITITKAEQKFETLDYTMSFTFSKTTETVLQKFSISMKMNVSGIETMDLKATFEYKETKNNPLSNDIDVDDTLLYKFKKSDLDIEYTLNPEAKDLINAILSSSGGSTNIDAVFGALEGEVTGFIDKNYMNIAIKELNGALYSADVRMLEDPVQTIDFNGFIGKGSIAKGKLWENGVAPVITPDWDFHLGHSHLIDSALDTFSTLFDADTAFTALKNNYTEMGFSSGPDLAFKISFIDDDIKYIKVAMSTKFTINVSKFSTNYFKISDIEQIPNGTIEMSIDMVAGLAYSSEGILLAQGLIASLSGNFSITIPIESLTAGNSNKGPDLEINGNINVDLDIQAKLDSKSIGVNNTLLDIPKINNIVDKSDFIILETTQTSLTTINSETSESAGFELLVTLTCIVAIPVIRKTRK